MRPTIAPGEWIVELHFYKNYERGDIVSFKNSQTNNDYYCKRIIGMPGDHIDFVDGDVFINDQKLDESLYLPEGVKTFCNRSFDVPNNTCFVLGDNRFNSFDSRDFSEPYIYFDDISGKVIPTGIICALDMYVY